VEERKEDDSKNRKTTKIISAKVLGGDINFVIAFS
jgi:hypothetical protein